MFKFLRNFIFAIALLLLFSNNAFSTELVNKNQDGGIIPDDIQKILNNYNLPNCRLYLNVKICVPPSANPYLNAKEKNCDSKDNYILALVLTPEMDKPVQKRPTILMVTAYKKEAGLAMTAQMVRYGYNVVVIEPRGTGSTPGYWHAMDFTEQYDNKYIIDDWIPSQPWSDGKVGMFGNSYMAISQMQVAALVDKDENGNPVHLKATFPAQGGADQYYDIAIPGGTMGIEFMLVFFTLTEGLRLIPPSTLINLDEKKFKWPSALELWEFIKLWKTHSDHFSDPFYDYMLNADNDTRSNFLWQLSPMLYWPQKPKEGFVKLEDKNNESAKVLNPNMPTYLVAGWYDIFLRGTLNHYTYGLSQFKNGDKGLMIGEWYHTDMLTLLASGISTIADMSFMARWFDWKLKGKKDSFSRTFPVLMSVMGVDRWRAEKDWPLPASRLVKQSLYLSKNKPSPIDGDYYTNNKKQASEMYSLAADKSDIGAKKPNPVLKNRLIDCKNLIDCTSKIVGGNWPVKVHGLSGRSPVRWMGGFTAIPAMFEKHVWNSPNWIKNKITGNYISFEDERDNLNYPGILSFTTEPMTSDYEITGALTLYFWAKSSFVDLPQWQIDFFVKFLKYILGLPEDNNFLERSMLDKTVQWAINIDDVYPDGRSQNITQGWLRAPFRPYNPNETISVKEHAIDPAYTPHDPFYLKPSEEPKPINENELYQYAVEILPTSNVFMKGHRIRLSITNSEFPHLIPVLTSSDNTIVIDENHEAKLDYTTVNNNDEGVTWKWITAPGELAYSKKTTSFDEYLLKNVDPEPAPKPEPVKPEEGSGGGGGSCFIDSALR